MHRWYFVSMLFGETNKKQVKNISNRPQQNCFELMSLNDQNILFFFYLYKNSKKGFSSEDIIKVSNFQYELDIDWFIHVKWLRKSEIQFFFQVWNQYARTLSEIDLISISFKKASRVNALEGAFNLIPYSMFDSIHLVSQVLPFCYCL